MGCNSGSKDSTNLAIALGKALAVGLLSIGLWWHSVALAAETPKPELEAEVPDRWAVENENYGKKWNVESTDTDDKWGVKPKPFSDSLGEVPASVAPLIHRGFKIDESVFPKDPSAEATSKKGTENQPDKNKAAAKPKKQGNKKTAQKEPKKAAAKKGKKSAVAKNKGKADRKSANKQADGKSIGKKGSYTKHALEVDGKPREYYVYLPAGYKKGSKLPVVVAFHGFQSDANGLRWLIKPDKWADKYQYIVVYPNAVKKSWNVGKGNGSTNKETDDWAFSKALYKRIVEKHPIDKKRLYVMGFSNGAQMAALWVCKMADKITAAAMVAHTMNIPGCKPSHRTPIALVHGMQDRLAPYKGGGKHKLASHAESVDFFKGVNGTIKNKIMVQQGKTYKCESWINKDKLTETIDCKMYNNGHSWPGGVEFMVDVLGTTNKELNANNFLFKFFSKYKKIPPAR